MSAAKKLSKTITFSDKKWSSIPCLLIQVKCFQQLTFYLKILLTTLITGSWLEPLANLARSAPRPASRDSRGDSKDEKETSGEDNEEKDVKDYPQLQLSDSLDLASKLRSHFLANLPAQSYAWLNGMNGVSTPNIPPSNYPNSWLNMGERNNRHQPSLLDSVKLDKHPLGGRDAIGIFIP